MKQLVFFSALMTTLIFAGPALATGDPHAHHAAPQAVSPAAVETNQSDQHETLSDHSNHTEHEGHSNHEGHTSHEGHTGHEGHSGGMHQQKMKGHMAMKGEASSMKQRKMSRCAMMKEQMDQKTL